MVTQSAKGEPYHVGKNLLEGATTIAKVAVALKKKHAFWPVPLKTPVNRASGDGDSSAVVEDAEAQANAFGTAKDGAGKAAGATTKKVGVGADTDAKSDEKDGEGETGAETPVLSNADGPEDEGTATGSAGAAPASAADDSDPLTVLRPAFEKDYATAGGQLLDVALERAVEGNMRLGFAVSTKWFGVSDGRVNVVSVIVPGCKADSVLKVGDEILAIDGFSYEGAPIEVVKEALRDVAAECILVAFRRPATPSNPDASLENILPGLPMSVSASASSSEVAANAGIKKPKKLFGTLSFNRGGKTYKRASKCGGSMYCHCQECYAKDLKSKEMEIARTSALHHEVYDLEFNDSSDVVKAWKETGLKAMPILIGAQNGALASKVTKKIVAADASSETNV
eukprot:gene18666-33930_t